MRAPKAKKPTGPLNEVFGDPKVTKILDFLLLRPEHQTKSEIRKGTRISDTAVESIITNLLNMHIITIGGQVYHDKTAEAENTYYVSKDSPAGRVVYELYEVIRTSRIPRLG